MRKPRSEDPHRGERNYDINIAIILLIDYSLPLFLADLSIFIWLVKYVYMAF